MRQRCAAGERGGTPITPAWTPPCDQTQDKETEEEAWPNLSNSTTGPKYPRGQGTGQQRPEGREKRQGHEGKEERGRRTQPTEPPPSPAEDPYNKGTAIRTERERR